MIFIQISNFIPKKQPTLQPPHPTYQFCQYRHEDGSSSYITGERGENDGDEGDDDDNEKMGEALESY